MTRDEALAIARRLVTSGDASPAAIARKIGRNRQNVAKVLAGKRACSLTLARQLADAARDLQAERRVRQALPVAGVVDVLALATAHECGMDPRDRSTRILGYYVAATAANISQAEIARAVGCSRQNIHKGLPKIEDLRDNPRIDAGLDRITALLNAGGLS